VAGGRNPSLLFKALDCRKDSPWHMDANSIDGCSSSTQATTDGGEIYGLAEGHLLSLLGLLPTCFASIRFLVRGGGAMQDSRKHFIFFFMATPDGVTGPSRIPCGFCMGKLWLAGPTCQRLFGEMLRKESRAYSDTCGMINR
jgi:hypothetical protein